MKTSLIKQLFSFILLLALSTNSLFAFCENRSSACESWENEPQCFEESSAMKEACDDCLLSCTKTRADPDNLLAGDVSEAGTLIGWWLELLGGTASILNLGFGCFSGSSGLMAAAGFTFILTNYMAQKTTDDSLTAIQEQAKSFQSSEYSTQEMALKSMRDILKSLEEDANFRTNSNGVILGLWTGAGIMGILETVYPALNVGCTVKKPAFYEKEPSSPKNMMAFSSPNYNKNAAIINQSEDTLEAFFNYSEFNRLESSHQSMTIQDYQSLKSFSEVIQQNFSKEFLALSYSLSHLFSDSAYALDFSSFDPRNYVSAVVGVALISAWIMSKAEVSTKAMTSPTVRSVISGAMATITISQIVWLDNLRDHYRTKKNELNQLLEKFPKTDLSLPDSSPAIITTNAATTTPETQQTLETKLDEVASDVQQVQTNLKNNNAFSSRKESTPLFSALNGSIGLIGASKDAISNNNLKQNSKGYFTNDKKFLAAMKTLIPIKTKALLEKNLKGKDLESFNNIKTRTHAYLKQLKQDLETEKNKLSAQGEVIKSPFDKNIAAQAASDHLPSSLSTVLKETKNSNGDEFDFLSSIDLKGENEEKAEETIDQAVELSKYELQKDHDLGSKEIPLWERIHNRYILQYESLGKIKKAKLK